MHVCCRRCRCQFRLHFQYKKNRKPNKNIARFKCTRCVNVRNYINSETFVLSFCLWSVIWCMFSFTWRLIKSMSCFFFRGLFDDAVCVSWFLFEINLLHSIKSCKEYIALFVKNTHTLVHPSRSRKTFGKSSQNE